jgi:hypothetical protein
MSTRDAKLYLRGKGRKQAENLAMRKMRGAKRKKSTLEDLTAAGRKI